MYVVFVTGGLASGKKTVCELLKQRGATVLDLDEIAKKEQESPLILEALVEEFGEDILADDFLLDRKLLAERAFESAEKANKLNEICWPPVYMRLVDLLVGGSCQPMSGGELLVVEIPLLVEASSSDVLHTPDFINLADEVISIEASADIRLDRAKKRGMDPKDAINRLNLQATDEERRVLASFVIDNNGSFEDLEKQVDYWYHLRSSEQLF